MSDLGSFGYGQVTPSDYQDDSNAIAFIVRQIISQLATVKVVKVAAVHLDSGNPPAVGTVDVIPLVKQMDGNGYVVEHKTVFGLRYVRLQAGKWGVIADPVVGDVGLILCADRDSTAVSASGQQATPQTRRRYSIMDGVYLGGILGAAPQAFLQLKSDGTFVINDQNGNILKSTGSGFEITGDMKITGKVQITGDTAITGNLTGTQVSAGAGSAAVSLLTHTHPGDDLPPTPGT